MEILQKRIANISNGDKQYCISKVYIDGVYSHDTIEDIDRGLTQDMSPEEISKIKVKGRTAIPTGTYEITLNVTSPKYSKSPFYTKVCKGKVPRFKSVPGYVGVLIHAGNTERDTEGCVVVGQNKIKGQVINSRETFTKLYKKLSEAKGVIMYKIIAAY